jgi:pyruvate dehydrogenase E2 component (dihydrolipoamide acetyltransferase)/2-oxoisovalerate dehydrogenase E2 component (dihydrolipoyl transacylase)
MDFKLPELGEGVYEAELVAWQVKPGDRVKRGEKLMEVLTDKASMEVPAPFAGTITQLRVEPGQNIKVGEVVLSYTPYAAGDGAVVGEDGAARSEAKLPEPANARASVSGPRFSAAVSEKTLVKAAPSVRYLARQLGVELGQVHGSGPGGRILVGDLSRFVKPSTAPVQAPEVQPDYGTPGTRVKLHGLRRKIAEHMVLAKKTIPHYSYVDECEVTELMRLRDSLRETFARVGIKLTYLAFFVKAAVAALKEVPLINASLDEKTEEVVLHGHYHIGVAVATPQGLVVPVVHDADKKDLVQIAREIERLSSEARTGKARLEDLRGGTFTITSIGNVGGLYSTPIINYPEAAILGIGKIVKRPVFDPAGNVRPADLLYLSFSFDHRLIDGAVGAAFGNALIRRLQNPATLLLPDRIS